MAWQLIYTSAPRLLEAGRSGFGTVARHRAIHPLLVTALERDSQFDRGAVAGRVVFAHRILTAAGARYHVLTCIRDAGADYTGRTNHIAHHLIFEPREIASSGASSPTPADVFREMSWCPAWAESHRWFEQADEIPLTRFHRQTITGAWQTFAGDERRAALIQPGVAVALILPPGAEALALYAESLSHASGQAWQATLTTCLQPSDDLSEFRWLALDAHSAQRDRAEVGRTVLDLTAPHTLPPPPAIKTTSFTPVPDALRIGSNLKAAASPKKPIGSLFDDALASHLPKRRSPRQSRLVLWLGITTVILGAAIIVFCLSRENPGITEQRAEIRRNVLSAFGGSEGDLATKMGQVSPNKLIVALDLAKAASETATALKSNELAKLPSLNAEIVSKQYQELVEEVPAPIKRLFQRNETFNDCQKELIALTSTPVAVEQLDRLRGLYNILTDIPAGEISERLRENYLKTVEKLWPARLLDLLKGDKEPKVNFDRFDVELGKLPSTLAKSVPAEEARALIADWRAVEAAGTDKTKIKTLRAEHHDWPIWLQNTAKAKLDTEVKGLAAISNASATSPAPAGTSKIEPEGPHFEGDLAIILDPTKPESWKSFAQNLTSGELLLFKGPSKVKGQKLLKRGNEYRESVTTDLAFRWDEKSEQFSTGPTAPTTPYELALIKDEKRISTAWVQSPNVPFRIVESGGLKREGDNIRIINNEAIDLNNFAHKQRWHSRLVWKSSSDLAFPLAPEGLASLRPRLDEITAEIEAENKKANEFGGIINGTSEPKQILAVIADMVAYAKESGFPEAKKDEDVKKPFEKDKDGTQRDKALAENQKLRDAVPPKPRNATSLGAFLRFASNGSVKIDKLTPIGEALEKKGDKANAQEIAESLKQVLEALANKKKDLEQGSQIAARKNEKEMKEAELKQINAKRDIKKVELLDEFIMAILNIPSLVAKANADLDLTTKKIASLGKHPLREKDILPSGAYELQIQPEPNGPWLLLVLFKNP